MIAKLENGSLIPCPKQGRDGRGGLHTNLPQYYAAHPQRGAADGYYPVRQTPRPAGDQTMSWSMQDGEIVQVWTPYTPQPEPEDPILARLEMIESCLLEMSETIYA